MRSSLLGLAVLALASGLALAEDRPGNKTLKVGDKAPTFDGIPAVMGAEATSLTLSDIKEEVIVLVFLGNHCPVVGQYEDRIIDAANAYKGKSVKFVGVSVNDVDQDRLPGIKDRVKEKGYNYVYGYDGSGQIGKAYGATRTPEFFVLDKARVVRYMGAFDDNNTEGKATKSYVKMAVDSLLAGKDVETSFTRARGCGIQYPSN